MTRREAREEAFVITFERIFSGDSVKSVIENAVEGRNLDVDDFTIALSEKTAEHEQETDEIISELSTKWKINRLPKTTLAILRMAITEIRFFEDIPVSVSANEAVEIAKKYSYDEDASYINGILGAYIKKFKNQKTKNE